MKGLRCIFIMAVTVMSIISCSTTRVLQDDQFRLAKNKIKIENDRKFNPNLLQPYLKQKPNSYFIFGWNPFLNVYNWQNGKGGLWDKFVTKIGVEPVVYDSEKVGESVENISNRLEYLGYYGSKVEPHLKLKKKRV